MLITLLPLFYYVTIDNVSGRTGMGSSCVVPRPSLPGGELQHKLCIGYTCISLSLSIYIYIYIYMYILYYIQLDCSKYNYIVLHPIITKLCIVLLPSGSRSCGDVKMTSDNSGGSPAVLYTQ